MKPLRINVLKGFCFMHDRVYMDVCIKCPKMRPKLGGCISGKTLMTPHSEHLRQLKGVLVLVWSGIT